MSAAANNWLKDRPLFTMIISSLIAIIVPLSIFAMKQESELMNQLNNKIEKKADVEYVDKRLNEHEKSDAARYDAIRDMFELTQQSNEKQSEAIRKSLDELHKDVREIRNSIK